MLCPSEGPEGTLARASEVTGPGVQWPGARGSGGMKGKDISKEASSVAERLVLAEPWQAQREVGQGPALGEVTEAMF